MPESPAATSAHFTAHADSTTEGVLAAVPVHFTTTGTKPVCDRADPALPLTVAFDPEDDDIDCSGCWLWLAGYRAGKAL